MARKGTGMQVVVPKSLVASIKSRQRPKEIASAGDEIRPTRLYDAINNSVKNYRNVTNLIALMRDLARQEGPFSTAVHNIVETAHTGYTLSAYDAQTGLFSPEGTLAAQNVVAQLDTPYDYTVFEQKRSFDGTIETMLREGCITGGVAGELVLNKALQADRIQVVGMETLTWKSDGKGGAYPAQRIAGQNDETKLNIPTFFVDRVHPDPGMTAPRSMLEAGVKMLVYFEEQMEDIRRVVRVSGHNRLTITLDVEKIKKLAPRGMAGTDLNNFMASVKDSVQEQLNLLNPEDTLVMFDSAKVDSLETGTGTKQDYTPLLNVAVGQYATAMKTPPSILGLRLESGSQALGNIESLMFLKSVLAVQRPVEVVMNRALTLACRLLGLDVYIWYRFDPIDLRPENELHAFRTMRQTQILQELSMGWISDDEAANLLGRFPRPVGAPNLSGTMFMAPNTQQQDNTTPGDTAMGRTLQPDKEVPRKGGGRSQ